MPRKIYPPKFNRYADGGTYGAHVDSAVMGLPGGLDSLRSEIRVRTYHIPLGTYPDALAQAHR